MEKQYLLTCISNTMQKGRIISRHCKTDNLIDAKEEFISIVQNVIGLNIKGTFEDNFKIIKKELIIYT